MKHDHATAQGLLALVRERGVVCAIGDGYVLHVHGIRDHNDYDVAVSRSRFSMLLNLLVELRGEVTLRMAPSSCTYATIECTDGVVSFFDDGCFGIEPLESMTDDFGNALFTLETVRKDKLMRGRDKDLADVKLIDAHLDNKEEYESCLICGRVATCRTCTTQDPATPLKPPPVVYDSP